VGGAGGVKVRVEVQVGNGVGESIEGLVKAEGVNGRKVGEVVGVKVGVAVGVDVGVAVRADVEADVEGALLFPSARERDKPPRSKPIETRAMKIPRNTCRKFFIPIFLQATLPGQASGR
jgi:hypothetical protein